MSGTFSRKTFLAARDTWAWGEFGPEWGPFRLQAAERGFIFPPTGTPHDDRDDEEPSQRAIVYEAIEERPAALRGAIASSRCWSDVVGRLISSKRALREEADLRDRDEEWERRDDLSRPGAAARLGDILRRASEVKS